MSVTIRPAVESDLFAWHALYSGYGEFYGNPLTDEKAVLVWGWLSDPAHPLTALVAEDAQGALVGLAHYRVFPRALAGGTGLYLDDLFVAEDARTGGVGTALIEHVRDLAKADGHSVVRWITAADNERAQAVYDKLATRTSWVTYDLEP
ncbi:N-acetyltransferase family protein [Plantibacter auratus]|jgi:GNAT superfamily N-acetyltransferase|uniref:GNAT family N-acetyltransferase n=1 Tax=Plantibacter auratus TaxID=272914 RepID=UPI003D3452DD